MTSKPNYPEAVERVDIEGLRALLAAIPAGMRPRWEVHEDTTSGVYEIRTCLDGDVDGDTGQHLVIGGEPVAFMADALGEYDLAALIVAAVNGLATLLNAKEAAEGEVADLMRHVRGEEGNIWPLEVRDAVDALEERYDISLCSSAFAAKHNRLRETAEAKFSTLAKIGQAVVDSGCLVDAPASGGEVVSVHPDALEALRQALSNLPKSGGVLEVAAADDDRPIPMLLFCPNCGVQHVDAPDDRSPEWANPPHRSHLCHACECIWRPADVPTEGVLAIRTVGNADTWDFARQVPCRIHPADADNRLAGAPSHLGNTPTGEVLADAADMLDEAAQRLGLKIDLPVVARKLRELKAALTPSVPLSTSGLSEVAGAIREALMYFGIQHEAREEAIARAAETISSLPPVSGLSEGEGAHCEMCGAGRGLGFRCPKCAQTNAALSPTPVLQGAGMTLTLLKNAIRECETRGDTTVYLAKSTADRILSSLASSPMQGEGQEPIGCPCPGACSMKGPLTPDQRASIICDFMNWPEDGPAWTDAHKLAAKLAAPKPDVTALVEALRPFARLYNQIVQDHGAEWFADEGHVMRASLAYPVASSTVVWRHFRLAAEALSAFQDHQGGK